MTEDTTKNELKTALAEVRGRLACAVVLAVLVFASVLLMGPGEAKALVRWTGYGFTFVLTAALGWYLFRAFSGRVRWPRATVSLGIGLAAVLGGSWILYVHSEFDYKIALDDYVLAATAKNLHETREVAYTKFGRKIGSEFVPIDVEVDKRPWFYPFVVASVHDVFGYSRAHPFLVNGLAGVLFLGGAFLFGRQLGGNGGGVASVLLWASIPLLAQNATGAGMEMLNVLVLQGVLLLGVAYLRSPDREREGALSLAAVLLPYTRYESGLFLLPVLLLIILGWWRSGRILLSWGSVLAIPLLLAVGWQTRIYAASESSWELTGGAERPFAWEHFTDNLPHALTFFFNFDDTLANSLWVAVLGVPAVVAFLVLLRSEWRQYRVRNPAAVVLAAFVPFYLLQLAFVLSFHAGRLDSPFVSRYGLSFYGLLIFSLVALLAYAADKMPRIWPVFLGATAVFILTFTLPMNAKAIFSNRNFAVREFNWLETVSGRSMEERALVIDRFPVPWTLRERSAVGLGMATANVDRIARELAVGKYPAGYLVERQVYSSDGFAPEWPAVAALLDVFRTEIVAERSFRPLERTRVHRLKAFSGSEGGAPQMEMKPDAVSGRTGRMP